MELTHPGAVLPAHEADWSRLVREQPGLLASVAHAAGGPFHLLHPATFAENVHRFRAALRAASVEGQVFYGAKANRSSCFLAACGSAGAGADVASSEEFAAALAAGLGGRQLVVTGPAKSTELLDLAVRHDALLALDALDELHRVLALADRSRRARVLLRVLPGADPNSRFGLDPAELDEAMARCAEHPELIEVEGFSFHLGGYEVAPRADLAAELVGRCLRARALGLAATSISIGGGFAVDYVPAADWAHFLSRHDDSWFHAGRRPERFYPYHQHPVGADMLTAILTSPAGPAGTLATALTRSGVRLLLEPGRALLDRAGITVFGVQGYKTRRDEHGDYGIVTVDGLSLSLSEQWKGSEFLPDPILWPPVTSPNSGPAVRASVGGASCLEYDMLTWRKIGFPRRPDFGDLLIYLNTAGYQMDKNESRFHGLPLPRRFVVETGTGGDLAWRLDRLSHRPPHRPLHRPPIDDGDSTP